MTTDEKTQLADRIAAKAVESSETIATKRLLALRASRGDQIARRQYEMLASAQAAIDLDIEILAFALDELNSPAAA